MTGGLCGNDPARHSSTHGISHLRCYWKTPRGGLLYTLAVSWYPCECVLSCTGMCVWCRRVPPESIWRVSCVAVRSNKCSINPFNVTRVCERLLCVLFWRWSVITVLWPRFPPGGVDSPDRSAPRCVAQPLATSAARFFSFLFLFPPHVVPQSHRKTHSRSHNKFLAVSHSRQDRDLIRSRTCGGVASSPCGSLDRSMSYVLFFFFSYKFWLF